MAINPGNRDYREWADTEAREYKGRTTPGEAFRAAASHAYDEGLSISRFLHNEDETARNSTIKRMIERAEISEDVELAHTTWAPVVGYKIDYSGLAEYVNEELGLELPTDEELMVARNQTLANTRDERQSIIQRSGATGQVAAFAGGTLVSMIDPVGVAGGIATAGIGTGLIATSKAMRSMSLAKSMAARGAAEGAVGGAMSAAAVEPFIYAWKQEIGSPYTFADSLFNVTASGVMGGGLGAFIGGMRARFGEATPENFEARGATEAEAKELARTIADAAHAPKGTNAEEYFEEMHAREADVESGVHNTGDKSFDALDEPILDEQYGKRSTTDEATGEVDPYAAEVDAIQAQVDHMTDIITCLKGS